MDRELRRRGRIGALRLRSEGAARVWLGLFGAVLVLAAAEGLLAQETMVTGRIEDAGTGSAVAGATVRAVAGGGAVLTDAQGRFRLAGASPGALVEVVASGYRRRSVELPAGGVIALEPDPFELDAVTVSATRNREAQADRTANVTVVGRAEIERRLMVTIEDLVRNEPGVTVFRQTSGTDPFNSFQGFKMRGVSGNRVQMMVDGSRVQERIIDGTRDLTDPANMKAVELVRGPASVLWGSDALGGLVAFTTKDPADYLRGAGDAQAVQLNVQYGDVDRSKVETVAAALRRGALEGLVSYTRRDAHEVELSKSRSDAGVWPCPRNPEATPCDQLDPTTIASDNLLSKLVWRTSSVNQWKLTGEVFRRGTDVDQRWDLGAAIDATGAVTATQTSFLRQQRLSRWRLALGQDWQGGTGLFDRVTWRVTYHPQSSERSGDRRRVLAGGDEQQVLDTLNYTEDFVEADIQLNSSFRTGAATHSLTYGLDGGFTGTDYERVDVTTNLTTGESTVARAGGFNFANAETLRLDAYLQDEIRLLGGALTVIPGLRVAHYGITPDPNADYQPVEGKEPREVSRTTATPKIGVIVRDRALSLYAQYAAGFKMPTAQQLYTSLPGSFFVLVPNPDLLPEEVDAYEIGVRGEWARGFLAMTGFLNDYDNFIQSFVQVPDTDPLEITYDNLASVQVLGVEASAGWRWTDRLGGTATVSYQRGDQRPDPASPETAPFDEAEPLGGTLTFRYVDPGIGLDAEINGRFQARTERVSSDAVFRPGGYSVYGAVVSWRPVPYLTLRMIADNLLDQRYFLPSAVTYAASPSSDDVARTNPIELQVQPGRSLRFGATVSF